MNEYSPTMIVAVVLVAFIAGYSLVSFVIRRLKSDIAKGRSEDPMTSSHSERDNLSSTDDDLSQRRDS